MTYPNTDEMEPTEVVELKLKEEDIELKEEQIALTRQQLNLQKWQIGALYLGLTVALLNLCWNALNTYMILTRK